MLLKDRVVVVTGSSGNVGRGVVDRLLKEGARVAGLDRSASTGPVSPERQRSLAVDLTDEAAVEQAFTAVEQGLGPVWGVLHIAGTWMGGTPVRDTETKIYDQLMAINLKTSFLVGRAAMRRLSGRGGRIAFVSAYTAATATGLSGNGVYAISKTGIIALTKVLAEEGQAAHVLVNCIAPGTIDTPANRAAMPKADPAHWVPVDAIAQTLIDLISPATAVSGAVVTLPAR